MSEQPGDWANRLREQQSKPDYVMQDSYKSPLPASVDKKFRELIDSKAEDMVDSVKLYKSDRQFAEMFFDDDEAIQKAVEYYQRAEDYAPQYKVAHSKKAKKGDTIPQTGVARMFTEVRKDLSVDSPTNPATNKKLTTVGMWQQNINVSEPAERDAAYDLILLNMISQVFLNYVKSVEIEAMIVSDRVVVSANDAGDIASIQQQALIAAIEKVPEQIKTGQDKDGNDKFEKLYKWQMEKHLSLKNLRSNLRTGTDPSDQVLDIVAAANMFPDSYVAAVSALKVIAADAIKNVKTSPAGLKNFISHKDYVSSIIVIEPVDHSHAEQNLMLGLIKSGYSTSSPVSIAGGKRPCTICFLSLCLTRELYPNLRYGIRPGGLYLGETKNGLAEICNALGINEALLKEKASYYLDKTDYSQFMTRYQELDLAGLAQAIARKKNDVTDQHKKEAQDIITNLQVPRKETMILENLEEQGLSSKQPTFALHPDFDRSSFGTYEGDNQMDVDDEYSSDEDEYSSDEEDTGPKEQNVIYAIPGTKELSDLLAHAAKNGWQYVLIKNSDPGKKLTIAGDADVQIRLKAGSNVLVNDKRTVVPDDDGVAVELTAGVLSMEDFHEVAVDVVGPAIASVLSKGKSRIRINNGLLYVKGISHAAPANVELHGGAVQALDYTILTKFGNAQATVEIRSKDVAIGPKALLDMVEFVDTGIAPQVF